MSLQNPPLNWSVLLCAMLALAGCGYGMTPQEQVAALKLCADHNLRPLVYRYFDYSVREIKCEPKL